MNRLRQWLEETHSDTFELVRHFLARFFDTEIGATNDDWRKVAIGIFASLVSLATFFTQIRIYFGRSDNSTTDEARGT
jgi:hypothetical protein